MTSGVAPLPVGLSLLLQLRVFCNPPSSLFQPLLTKPVGLFRYPAQHFTTIYLPQSLLFTEEKHKAKQHDHYKRADNA